MHSGELSLWDAFNSSTEYFIFGEILSPEKGHLLTFKYNGLNTGFICLLKCKRNRRE
jgi:hypothetical protein